MEFDLHVFAIDSPYNRAFVEFINRNFSDRPNFFVIMREKAAVNFTLPEQKNIIYLPANDISRYGPFYQLFNQAGRIFAHSLFEPALSVFATYPGQKKIIAIFWGSDVAPFFFKTVYDRMDDRTRNFFQGNKLTVETYKQKADEWDMWRKMNLITARVTHTLSSSSYTQQMMNIIFDRKMVYLPFHYHNPVDCDEMEGNELPQNPAYRFKERWEKVVMMNHSGNPANNHISLIDWLAQEKSLDFGVVAPLSYGAGQVQQPIINYAKEKLGDHFAPITEFLPPREYAAVMRQTDAFLMNSIFSGGAANIKAFLQLGRKVYINSRNISTLGSYKSGGIQVFPLEVNNLDQTSVLEIFDELDEEAKQNNRQALETMASEQRLIGLYRDILTATE